MCEVLENISDYEFDVNIKKKYYDLKDEIENIIKVNRSNGYEITYFHISSVLWHAACAYIGIANKCVDFSNFKRPKVDYLKLEKKIPIDDDYDDCDGMFTISTILEEVSNSRHLTKVEDLLNTIKVSCT